MEVKFVLKENTIYIFAKIDSINRKFILDTGMFIPIIKDDKCEEKTKIFTLNGIMNGEMKDSVISFGVGMTLSQKIFYTNKWDEDCDGVMPFSILEKWLNCIDFENNSIKKINNYDSKNAFNIDKASVFVDFNIYINDKACKARIDTGSPISFIKKEIAIDKKLSVIKSEFVDASGNDFFKLEKRKNITIRNKNSKIDILGEFLIIDKPIDFRKRIDFIIGNDILSNFKKIAIIRNKNEIYLQI